MTHSGSRALYRLSKGVTTIRPSYTVLSIIGQSASKITRGPATAILSAHDKIAAPHITHT